MAPREIVSAIENQELLKKRHEQIVGAASKLFAEKGFHRTTMREISKACKIELSQLYQYISSKDDILYLYYMRIYELIGEYIRSLLYFDEEDPVGQLKGYVRSMLECVEDHEREFLTMYTESRHLEHESLIDVLSLEHNSVTYLEAFIRKGKEKGIFKINDCTMTANFITHLLMTKPLRGWNFRKERSFGQFAESLIEFILDALGVEKDRR
ncbi:MAG: TetR/AcrR family transcriptional regulator [Deltaproteobacteria bacterium]|nr:TetR/AcrR family transcriptional regulator [Deltaproteobacteria bacterium]